MYFTYEICFTSKPRGMVIKKGVLCFKKIMHVKCYTHLIRVCKCKCRGMNSWLTVSKVTQREELRRGVERPECGEDIVPAKVIGKHRPRFKD